MNELKLDEVGTVYEDVVRPMNDSLTYRLTSVVRKEGTPDPSFSFGVIASDGSTITFVPLSYDEEAVTSTGSVRREVQFTLDDLPAGTTEIRLTAILHNVAVLYADEIGIEDITSEANAEIAKTEAVDARIDAESASSAASTSASLAVNAEVGANSAASASATSATVAESHATASENSSQVSQTNRIAAEAAETAAEGHATAANTSASTAAASSTDSENFAIAAEASSVAASAARSDSEGFANASSTSSSSAAAAATDAGNFAAAANQHRLDAETEAGNAATSATQSVTARDEAVTAKNETDTLVNGANGIGARVNEVATALGISNPDESNPDGIAQYLAEYALAVTAGTNLAGLRLRATDGTESQTSVTLTGDQLRHESNGQALFESLSTGFRVIQRLIVGASNAAQNVIIDDNFSGDPNLVLWVGAPTSNPTRANANAYFATDEIKLGAIVLDLNANTTTIGGSNGIVSGGSGITIGGSSGVVTTGSGYTTIGGANGVTASTTTGEVRVGGTSGVVTDGSGNTTVGGTNGIETTSTGHTYAGLSNALHIQPDGTTRIGGTNALEVDPNGTTRIGASGEGLEITTAGATIIRGDTYTSERSDPNSPNYDPNYQEP